MTLATTLNRANEPSYMAKIVQKQTTTVVFFNTRYCFIRVDHRQ